MKLRRPSIKQLLSTTWVVARLTFLTLSLPALALQPPLPGEMETMQAQGTWAEVRGRAEQLGNPLLSPELLQKTNCGPGTACWKRPG